MSLGIQLGSATQVAHRVFTEPGAVATGSDIQDLLYGILKFCETEKCGE
jgi:hypothetical protein